MNLYLSKIIDNHKKESPSLEVLKRRIDTCLKCEHFREVSCGVCGCSSYRFKEVLTHANRACPKGKFEE